MKKSMCKLAAYCLSFVLVFCCFPAFATGDGNGTGNTANGVHGSDISITPNPLVTDGEMIDLALNVYQDLLDNWWTGNAKTGHVIDTDCGKPYKQIMCLWEPAMAIFAMDTLYEATGYKELHDRIVAEWNYIRQCVDGYDVYVDAGHGFNIAQDDAGWHAMLYMTAYKHTGDDFALDVAEGLLKNSFAYWANGDLATGGLLYAHDLEDPTQRHNSLHAVSLLNAAFEYLEYRDDPQLEKDTMDIYNWLENHMLREGEFSYIYKDGQQLTGFCDDNLYWFNYNQQREGFPEYTGPEGASSPNTIKEGQSTVFLGGTMGMAALHARLYKKSGEEKYLERAQRTLRAVNDNKYLVSGGIYVNAGDAWTNASFMRLWVQEVMTLPGLQEKDVKILYDTADSIYSLARTDDGYYSASWSGPADDRDTAWGKMGWTHDTIMCSATSMHMIFAAALAESMALL